MSDPSGPDPAGSDPAGSDPAGSDSSGSDPVLFFENGASWHWLWLGVAGGLAMVFVQYGAGLGFRATLPLFFLVVMCSVLALQVRAARQHTSVELTADTLRQGTETLPIGEILAVYPEAENTVKSGQPIEVWQEARTLGELNGVPKGRTGIGLRLANDRTAQAWARDDEALRAALMKLVES